MLTVTQQQLHDSKQRKRDKEQQLLYLYLKFRSCPVEGRVSELIYVIEVFLGQRDVRKCEKSGHNMQQMSLSGSGITRS